MLERPSFIWYLWPFHYTKWKLDVVVPLVTWLGINFRTTHRVLMRPSIHVGFWLCEFTRPLVYGIFQLWAPIWTMMVGPYADSSNLSYTTISGNDCGPKCRDACLYIKIQDLRLSIQVSTSSLKFQKSWFQYKFQDFSIDFLCYLYRFENKILILYLYYDDRRDIWWNIAWAWGKSRGRSPRDFLRVQTPDDADKQPNI